MRPCARCCCRRFAPLSRRATAGFAERPDALLIDGGRCACRNGARQQLSEMGAVFCRSSAWSRITATARAPLLRPTAQEISITAQPGGVRPHRAYSGGDTPLRHHLSPHRCAAAMCARSAARRRSPASGRSAGNQLLRRFRSATRPSVPPAVEELAGGAARAAGAGGL